MTFIKDLEILNSYFTVKKHFDFIKALYFRDLKSRKSLALNIMIQDLLDNLIPDLIELQKYKTLGSVGDFQDLINEEDTDNKDNFFD